MNKLAKDIAELNQEFIKSYSEDDINSSPMLAIFIQLLHMILLHMIEVQIMMTGILLDELESEIKK